MELEKIARKALFKLKVKWGIPKTGFITGGSISNMIWEMISGNQAVVNDIDVFILQPMDDSHKEIYSIKKTETEYIDHYGQLSFRVKSQNVFSIVESTNDGIFNFVKYKSEIKSPSIVIDNFDINAVMFGYSIDEDKFYWNEHFVEFLETGKLKVLKPKTPNHTAIRLAKKIKELNCECDDIEFEILSFCSSRYIGKKYFTEKLAKIYEQNREKLEKYFSLKRGEHLEKYLSFNKGVETKLWTLDSKIDHNFFNLNNQGLPTEESFIFYIRNIRDNPKYKEIWDNLYFYFNDVDYLSGDENLEDIKLLSEISKSNPAVVKNLSGLTLSQQISLVKEVLDKITEVHNYETAIAVLENIKLSPNYEFDEDNCLLLGLNVRKKVKSKKKAEIGFLFRLSTLTSIILFLVVVFVIRLFTFAFTFFTKTHLIR